MRRIGYFSLLLLSVTWMLLAYSWTSRHTYARPAPGGDRKILYYIDPMNPSHTSDAPGVAPCGMAMEPVYAESEEASMPPGSMKISSLRQQLIGIRVGLVEESSHTHSFRTIGRVAPDETRIHRVIAGAPGFIREISDITTDSYVEKGQWLASFSSPDSIASIQSYIVALNAMDRLRGDNAERSAENLEGGATYQLRVEKLQELGISSAQMEEIKQTRAVPRMINILSPADGFVLSREVWQAQKFDRGVEWYRIADLSRVWIVADVFERDAKYVKAGGRAMVCLPGQEARFETEVAEVRPAFDPKTRTLKVRLVAENHEFTLRPGMTVDVEFQVSTSTAVTIPVDAVINSGTRKTVFVDHGNGFFEPREIRTALYSGEQVQVTEGLVPGEKIVLSGAFLLNSEAQMRRAASMRLAANEHGREGMADHHHSEEKEGSSAADSPKCAVCRMRVQGAQMKDPNLSADYQGKTYYFCSRFCKGQFAGKPQFFSARAMAEEMK